jgi:hypothetical protein
MAEMTRRERLMAVSLKKKADRLPFFHYWRHSQIGWAERECRNRGMGMTWDRSCFTTRLHDVRVVEERAVVNGQSVVRRTYNTPVGSVYEDEIPEPGVGQWHGNRSWKDVTPWVMHRMIGGPEDYPVVKFIVEHTEYLPDYFPIEQAMDWLGEDGVVMEHLPHSPMQMLMIDYVGSDSGRFFYHYADYPDLVEELYRALVKSRLPLHDIAAKSPAPITLCGDNVDGFLVTPKLFEKYFMPVYDQQAQVLHAQGKLMAVHMDGRLSNLKNLIARTSVDIVEALHPPPMGNLPVSQALAAWPEKAIWLGFPGGIYEQGPKITTEYTVDLLRDMGTGDRLAVAMSTENLVSNDNMIAVTSVLEDAELPLTEAKIRMIEKKVAAANK